MSIHITGLSKKIGSQLVLNNISFEVGTGEVVGFLGPNGAGKTTTMRILTGSLSYETGSVRVGGLEVRDNRQTTNAMIGYLPENNPLYPDMYVGEYLDFVAQTYGIRKNSKSHVDELIERVGLLPEAHKKIGQLSKGYKQRVGLAQALISDPKVLILDEPTTGLDPNQLAEIRQLIREIGKDKTVLLSTHIMQEVKAICNRVLIINQGEIVADYPDISKINLADENNRQFEVVFLNEVDVSDLERISQIAQISVMEKNSYLLTASIDISTAIFDFAVQSNNKILQLKEVENSMEDVFRKLTR
jgi:ABC-2 type transport system ATP-binding protein